MCGVPCTCLPPVPQTAVDFGGASVSAAAAAAAAAGLSAGKKPLSPVLAEMDAETETNTRPLPLKETVPGEAETHTKLGFQVETGHPAPVPFDQEEKIDLPKKRCFWLWFCFFMCVYACGLRVFVLVLFLVLM